MFSQLSQISRLFCTIFEDGTRQFLSGSPYSPGYPVCFKFNENKRFLKYKERLSLPLSFKKQPGINIKTYLEI